MTSANMLDFPPPPMSAFETELLPCSCAGCPTGNGVKLNSNQAEASQAINSRVAYFALYFLWGILPTSMVQRSAKQYANLAKQDPSNASQNR